MPGPRRPCCLSHRPAGVGARPLEAEPSWPQIVHVAPDLLPQIRVERAGGDAPVLALLVVLRQPQVVSDHVQLGPLLLQRPRQRVELRVAALLHQPRDAA
eukprot:7571808-Pyramimonas_sp.AAC.1